MKCENYKIDGDTFHERSIHIELNEYLARPYHSHDLYYKTDKDTHKTNNNINITEK